MRTTVRAMILGFVLFGLLKSSLHFINEKKNKLTKLEFSNELKCAICGGKSAELPNGEFEVSDFFLIENKLYKFNKLNHANIQVTKHLKCAVAQILLQKYQLNILEENKFLMMQKSLSDANSKYSDILFDMNSVYFHDIGCLAFIAISLFHEYVVMKTSKKLSIYEYEFALFVEYVAANMPDSFNYFVSCINHKLKDSKSKGFALTVENKTELQNVLVKACTYVSKCTKALASCTLISNNGEVLFYDDVYFLYLLTKLDYLFETYLVSDMYKFVNKKVSFSNVPHIAKYEVFKTIFCCLTIKRLKTETMKMVDEIKQVVESTLVKLSHFRRLIDGKYIVESIYKGLLRALPRDGVDQEKDILKLERIFVHVTQIENKISQLPATRTVLPSQVLEKLRKLEQHVSKGILSRQAENNRANPHVVQPDINEVFGCALKQLDTKSSGNKGIFSCSFGIISNPCVNVEFSRDTSQLCNKIRFCNITALNIAMTGSLELVLKQINELFKFGVMEYPSINIAVRTGLTLSIILETIQFGRKNKYSQFFIKPQPKFHKEFDVLLKEWNWDYKTLKTTSHEHLYMNPSYFSTNNLQSVMFFYDALNEIYNFPNQ